MIRIAKRLSIVGTLLVACSLVTIAAQAEGWRVYGNWGFTSGWSNFTTSTGKRMLIQNNNWQVIVAAANGESNPPPFSAYARCNDGTEYGGLTIPSGKFPDEHFSTATCSDHGGVDYGAAYILE